jgi:MinD superfamily P-loop ATPase
MVCINKVDLNPDLAGRIEEEARALGLPLVGRIPYDLAVTEAQVRGTSVVEGRDGPASREIRALWERVKRGLTEEEHDVEHQEQVPKSYRC